MGLHKVPLSFLPTRMCSLASEYESEWCCVLQICFLMHASAECAEASLLSTINKITEAARAAARLVFDDPSQTGDGSKCPVMQLINHTHTARNPRLFCIRGCVGNCVEEQRGPACLPSPLPPAQHRRGYPAEPAAPRGTELAFQPADNVLCSLHSSQAPAWHRGRGHHPPSHALQHLCSR